MEGPGRLFSRDPELARVRALLDRDGPPSGAAERALAKIGGGAFSRGRRSGRSIGLELTVVAGAALLGIAAWQSAHTASLPAVTSSEAPPLVSAPVASTSAASSAPTVLEPAPTETVRVEDLPRAATSPAPAASPASPGDPFEQELALVEQARAALAGGRGSECLVVAAQHRKRFSNRGQFNEEIEVMRIEALAMTGDRARARAQAAQFLERHGDTPYAVRLRRVLESSAGEP